MHEPTTPPVDPFAVIAFPESTTALVIASRRASATFGYRPRRFATWIREQMHQLGPELTADIQRLPFKSVDLLVLAVRVSLGARAPVDLVAAVMPDESGAGEKALHDLRERLIGLNRQEPA